MSLPSRLIAVAVALAVLLPRGQAGPVDESVALEAHASLQRAVAYLVHRQGDDGLWSEHAGISGAVILALAQSEFSTQADVVAAIERGCQAIAKTAQDDGSFRHPGLNDDVYATATCLLALAVAKPDDATYQPIIARAQDWLIQHQQPAGPSYGQAAGFRYAENRYPDLSNTQWAIEAIQVAETVLPQQRSGNHVRAVKRQLAGAISFISACQIQDGDDAGAFSYFPRDADITPTPHDDAIGAKRIWGSLTYGAIKTLHYGDVPADDPRLQNAIAWSKANHSVKSNPGLEDGGYFYYLFMYATAHNQLVEHYDSTWQKRLIETLLARQKGDGQWQNENPLWLERDPALCTAYATLAITAALVSE